ncbi:MULTISPECIES: Hint domain-containing protein [unclassified Ruegeria]|uniref:Hint domain-containing protein n=1 Tax=unclassified Ruegeria TaxID=2625375 RepID=UPI0014889634|nr:MULTISPECIES: Hint domain-containing protein [unclassified Ruegeria]NOD63147.1 calcium-binding protein [Ruegeria sp. HKCCD6109]
MPAIISEIRYRNGPNFAPDGDFIEVRVPTGTDVTGLQVDVYNSNGTVRSSTDVDTATMTTVGGFDYYVVTARINRLGAVSLSDNGSVLSFVSFDAQVTATQGPANGQTSTQIGSNGTDDTSSLSSTDGVNFVQDPNPSPGAPCFTSDTLILTDQGEVLIQDIEPGMRVMTTDGTLETVRMRLSRTLRHADLLKKPELYPVCIMAGSLGHGLPRRDLIVSRQHRMLVRSAIAQRMFATRDVLISAIRLTELPGIYVDDLATKVTYHHLIFERHVVLFAEGAPSESLFTGPEALKSLSPEAQQELLKLFPSLISDQEMAPACHIPSGRRQKTLVARHIRNSKAMLDQPLF